MRKIIMINHLILFELNGEGKISKNNKKNMKLGFGVHIRIMFEIQS
jgi:hypothetical protein